MDSKVILWVYILLLVAGGLIGFLKAKSKVSLYMSLGFAVALSLAAVGIFPRVVADWLLGALLVVFAIRLIKTKRFMPAGMMLVVTMLTMALWYLV